MKSFFDLDELLGSPQLVGYGIFQFSHASTLIEQGWVKETKNLMS
jgi:hypothetical protein